MADSSGHKSTISLLLVEDDEPTLEFLGKIIAKKYPEITIHTADDGRKGLKLFQAHVPDIVITDCNMPEMHGMQMATNIRAIKPDTMFIFLTGDSGLIDLQDSDEKGLKFDRFIVKPVKLRDLYSAIEQCLGEMV
jgi:YesN/AraC family two-component response regulator